MDRRRRDSTAVHAGEYVDGEGIAALYALPEVTAADRQKAEAILRAVGEAVWVDEERLLDPVTAVSASGPAYVFWFIEQLAASAAKLGIPAEDALKLAKQTVLGAAQLAASSAESPETLRRNVTSKGGTTEAALKVFEEEKLAERFLRAIEAASERGAQMGRELGETGAGKSMLVDALSLLLGERATGGGVRREERAAARPVL